MIKIKIFSPVYQQTIQTWLIDHINIDIISTNLTSNEYGSIYTILYREKGATHE
jgi:hypothetical protein